MKVMDDAYLVIATDSSRFTSFITERKNPAVEGPTKYWPRCSVVFPDSFEVHHQVHSRFDVVNVRTVALDVWIPVSEVLPSVVVDGFVEFPVHLLSFVFVT